MQFIELGDYGSFWPWALTVAVMLVLAIALFIMADTAWDSAVPVVLAIVLLAGMYVALIAGFVILIDARDDAKAVRNAAVAEQILETYGLTVNVAELCYPGKKPGAASETYCSAPGWVGDEAKRVTLAWDGSKMLLQSGTEIPHAG